MSVHEAPHYDAPPTERLLTVNEIADRLAISRDTVYRLVRSGDLHTVRVGERLRFRPPEIDAYLERNRSR
jgi:excisionase family DNA binding protein